MTTDEVSRVAVSIAYNLSMNISTRIAFFHSSVYSFIKLFLHLNNRLSRKQTVRILTYLSNLRYTLWPMCVTNLNNKRVGLTAPVANEYIRSNA